MCVMVNLDIYVIDIVPLDNYSLLKLFILTSQRVIQELVETLYRGMRLEPIKQKVYFTKQNPI